MKTICYVLYLYQTNINKSSLVIVLWYQFTILLYLLNLFYLGLVYFDFVVLVNLRYLWNILVKLETNRVCIYIWMGIIGPVQRKG